MEDNYPFSQKIIVLQKLIDFSKIKQEDYLIVMNNIVQQKWDDLLSYPNFLLKVIKNKNFEVTE